jgi:hypothetical protein
VNDALMLAIGLLADDAPRDTGPDFGKASPFGRKLPKSFDDEPDAEPKSEPGG